MKKHIAWLLALLLTVSLALPVPAARAADRVTVYLDGSPVSMDADPEIRGGRTMVPLRAVAERLGARVQWDADARQVTMTRAGTEVVMTVGRTDALVNGEPIPMDAAPCISGGRTLIPARYMAEFFVQTVAWDAAARRVDIAEDKSAAGDSNLEAWAKPMGAYLTHANRLDPAVFGAVRSKGDPAGRFRELLGGDSWGIGNREDLIETVCRMTRHGHNEMFLHDAAMIAGWTDAEYRQVLAGAQGMDAYMFPYTKQLGEKWGERGILCWDLFRMSNLVQWGYLAGYLTYAEALALLEPAAKALCENFSGWDEAYENYLDGYNWWARNDVLDQDVMQTQRGRDYQAMKKDANTAAIFDDGLFRAGVTGVPSLSAAALLGSVQGA